MRSFALPSSRAKWLLAVYYVLDLEYEVPAQQRIKAKRTISFKEPLRWKNRHTLHPPGRAPFYDGTPRDRQSDSIPGAPTSNPGQGSLHSAEPARVVCRGLAGRKANTETVNRHATAQGALAVGALGVVFGDIGTSPIYTIQTVFNPGDPHPIRVSAQNVFGVVSLIFWSVMIIVTVTYVLLVMRADNDGEGGIMALITLIRRRGVPGGRRAAVVLAVLGVFGASLFFGDSMITPAISVLSAVEGVKVAAPSLASLVVPITAAIIVGLFLVQRLGTGAVGRLFGPVMVVWFTAIGAFGIRGIAGHPAILKALSPTYAHRLPVRALPDRVLLAGRGRARGHRRRGAVRRHGALRPRPDHPRLAVPGLSRPASSATWARARWSSPTRARVSSPFFLLVPGLGAAADGVPGHRGDGDRLPGGDHRRVLGRPAGRPARLPAAAADRAHLRGTTIGQIYVPWINWVLMVAVLTLVFAFRSSAALAYAFGMAVTGTITITTLLFFYIAREQWHWPLWLVVPGAGCPARRRPAVLRRQPDQARARRLAAAADRPSSAFTVLTTWQRGRELVTRQRAAGRGAAAGVHRRAPRDEAAAAPRAGHRRLPQPRQGHRAAGACAPTSSTTTSCTSTS